MLRTVLLALFAAGAPVAAQDSVRIAVGPFDPALTTGLHRLSGLRLTILPRAGSFSSLALLEAGGAELATASGPVLPRGQLGDKQFCFKGKQSDVRLVARLGTSVLQIAVRAGVPAATFADLKDKRVSIGPLRSDAELVLRAVLAAAGIRHEEFSGIEYLPTVAGAGLLRAEKLDAIVHLGPLPDDSFAQLLGSADVNLLELPAASADKIGGAARKATIRPNTYRGQAKAVATVELPIFVVANAALPDKIAAVIAKALDDALAGKAAPDASEVKALGTAMHPGAARYFQEKRAR